MFKYSNGKNSKPGEKQFKTPTAIRKVTYINPHPNPKVRESVITEGWEIVQEAITPLTDNKVETEPTIVGYKTVEFKAPVKPLKKEFNKNDKEETRD